MYPSVTMLSEWISALQCLRTGSSQVICSDLKPKNNKEPKGSATGVGGIDILLLANVGKVAAKSKWYREKEPLGLGC